MTLRPMATLARWLGPWADPAVAPVVATHEDLVDGLRVRVYQPPRTAAAPFVMAPGLHYAGPDDPRMDRFCRVLAAAGHLVIAPFIPAYLALTPNQAAIDDFLRVVLATPRWTTARPTVFSISFGSLLAFATAAAHPDAIDGLVIFGGYADFHATMRFCLTGEVETGRVVVRDPLNQAVVLMNLLPYLDCGDPDAVRAGWRRYVERTWGRPELKDRARFTRIAEDLAPGLPEAVRELFLVGVGVRPGADRLATEALTRFDARALDPGRFLARVRGRVELVHGAEDDVIPFEQSHALARQLVHAQVRVHVTGLYGHTGARTPRPAAVGRELATMVRVLRVLGR